TSGRGERIRHVGPSGQRVSVRAWERPCPPRRARPRPEPVRKRVPLARRGEERGQLVADMEERRAQVPGSVCHGEAPCARAEPGRELNRRMKVMSMSPNGPSDCPCFPSRAKVSAQPVDLSFSAGPKRKTTEHRT